MTSNKGRFGRSHSHHRGSRPLGHTRVEPLMNGLVVAGLVNAAPNSGVTLGTQNELRCLAGHDGSLYGVVA